MMDTFSISAFPPLSEFEQKIDTRLKHFLKDWQLKSNYEGTPVNIPGHTNSSFDPIRYFQVIKKSGEAFFRSDERDNEICLTLWAHWPGYDHEAEVNLFITGKDVKNSSNYKVRAEILKAGGAEMKIYWKNILVTDFNKTYTTGGWFLQKRKTKVDKMWIDDLEKICKIPKTLD